MTIPDALRLVRLRLGEAGVDGPYREARALVAFVSCLSTAEVAVSSGSVDAGALHAALARRMAREPMAFIAGTREFYGLEFAVSPATLIPRPDSETLVDCVLREADETPYTVLDLGTGTGCLLLSVLHGRPAWRGIGVDRAPAAAALARRNAVALGLADRALIVAADWGAAIDPAARFDVILSNPPYIARGDLAGLMPEVGLHEPTLALDGGPDGLAAFRLLAPLMARHLAPAGFAVVEMGEGQHEAVRALFQDQGFVVTLVPDLAGILRAAVVRWAGAEKGFGSAAPRR